MILIYMYINIFQLLCSTVDINLHPLKDHMEKINYEEIKKNKIYIVKKKHLKKVGNNVVHNYQH